MYNLCDYNYYKSHYTMKKGTILYDYIILKLSNVGVKKKRVIVNDYNNTINYINKQLNINMENLEEDDEQLLLKLLSINEIREEKISIEKMLDYIINNYNNKILVIYDSSLFKIKNNENVIMFDLNTRKQLEDYNIIYSNTKFININIAIIVNNFYEYWPIPISEKKIYDLVNLNFINLFNKEKINTYDSNISILSKLINYFYNKNIHINYYGKNNTIKSFLNSSIKK